MKSGGDREEAQMVPINTFYESRVVLWMSKLIPITQQYDTESRCFVKITSTSVEKKSNGSLLSLGQPTWHATQNFLILVSLAVSDVVFALDSIPAILSITTGMVILVQTRLVMFFSFLILFRTNHCFLFGCPVQIRFWSLLATAGR